MLSDKNKLNIQEVAIFKDSPVLVYLYKKTEKLVSALYMLSSFISDREPIKWQMREAGVSLLSQSLSLSDRASSERILSYNNFISTVLKFISLLEVSYAGGVISEMNYEILRSEFESLIQDIESSGRWSDAKGLIFPEHFFDIPKGQDSLSDRNSPLTETSVKTEPVFQRTLAKPQGHSIEGKNDRSQKIIGLLKKKDGLGIKDFSIAISGCSEKTIQRELAGLVLKGLVTKEGEKRWSRYSLKA